MIAPTDPISVLATFRAGQVKRELSTVIESESLLSDGIAVVLYVLLLDTLGGAPLSPAQAIGDFALVVFGGAVLGLGLGSLTARVLERIDDHLVEVTLTLELIPKRRRASPMPAEPSRASIRLGA